MLSKLVLKNTFLFLVLLIFSCGNSIKKEEEKDFMSIKKETILNGIKTGADNWKVYLPILKTYKNIGVVANQSSLVDLNLEKEQKHYPSSSKTIHLVDWLIENKINVSSIFAPEHGFRGTADAGELIKNGKDTKTNLPIISLYGNNKKPKPEQLKNIDIIIFDLQDVGARFYTYISSLHYVMEACAENNIPLIVLDRPNPNGGIIDGPILEPEFKSFVGMHEIPVLHGMTIGEYAKMINGEKWLKNNIQCDLRVIPCLHYNKNIPYSLPVKPSPNLPNTQAINLYASLCFFEGTNVSVGRGTDKQFQIYGSPYLPKSSFNFTPKPNEGAKDPLYNGKTCYGEDLTKIEKINQLELKWLIKAYNQTSDKSKFFNSFFTKLAGTKKLQQQIESGQSEAEIKKTWEKDINSFKKMRASYLIYEN